MAAGLITAVGAGGTTRGDCARSMATGVASMSRIATTTGSCNDATGLRSVVRKRVSEGLLSLSFSLCLLKSEA